MFKPRYIPAEEAEERIVTLWRKERSAYADVFNTAIDACQTVILDMYDNSTEDVIPVVRCRDCKYFKQSPRLWGEERTDGGCRWIQDKLVEQDFYCAWGEKRTDETD